MSSSFECAFFLVCFNKSGLIKSDFKEKYLVVWYKIISLSDNLIKTMLFKNK